MSMTDLIADMLARLRNANLAFHESVSMPYSKLKAHIAKILEHEGYITGFGVKEAEIGRALTLNLKYGSNRGRVLTDLWRISKPGLRIYAKSVNLPKVPGGLGVAILSASSGLLMNHEAKNKGADGEVLAYVW